LRDGLIVLADSGREGELRGQDGDLAWRDILGEAGVVELGDDETYSVGRKWRSAMCRLGFLYDDVGADIQGKVGAMDYITPNGHRLIEAASGPAQQECYLRALAGMWLDVSSSRHKVAGDFSPLRHVLRVLRELEVATGSSGISAVEFAVFVQTTDDTSDAVSIVKEILSHRKKRLASTNKKKFDDAAIIAEAKAEGAVSPSTYRDYMDMNLRYLKATGLFHAFGRGISLVSLRGVLIDGLISQTTPPKTTTDYWVQLTNGAVLPTDNMASAEKALGYVRKEAEKRGIKVEAAPAPGAAVADISRLRHDIELKLALDDEVHFYHAQRTAWEEIAEFLALLNGKKPEKGSDIIIPSGEGPAYFEWTLWRAFLAINTLANTPFEARKFAVDQDMRPLSHAPGGGPDLVFEFDKFVLVVEVTLSTSIRQEGTEGVPVRHHVHLVQTEYPTKPVYGLFIAPKLAPSTVDTFKARKWYPPEGGDAVEVSIVPAKLAQFRDLFVAMFLGDKATPDVMLDVVEKALGEAAKHESPSKWEKAIDSIFEGATAAIVA
jgi:hypothetical protein